MSYSKTEREFIKLIEPTARFIETNPLKKAVTIEGSVPLCEVLACADETFGYVDNKLYNLFRRTVAENRISNWIESCYI